MKRKNAARSALFTSMISLLLCVSMLVGTTFAWFTDEVKTGMNTIAAGNLDIELYANGVAVNNGTKLFDDVTLWEPGVVVYENLQIKNAGTLALKYQMTLNFGSENELNGHKLSEVLKVAIIDKVAPDAKREDVLNAAKAAQGAGMGTLSNFYEVGELAPGAATDEKAVVVYWAPNDNATDNLYNANNGQTTSDGEPLHIEFGVNLQATQKVHENDSFGNDYDELSSILPKATVNNVTATYSTINAAMGIGGSVESIPMDIAMQFLPNEKWEVKNAETGAMEPGEAQNSEYRYWIADYVVTADQDVPANSMALAGYYSAFCDAFNGGNWVALTSDTAIPANTPITLVEAMGNGSIAVHYQDICQYGNDGKGFLCGAVDLTGENAGTTLTVELRMFETTYNPATGEGDKYQKTGNSELIGKYTYTFGSSTAEGLQAALAAGNPRIELDSDVVLNDNPLVITNDVVIDLNGHTISGISTSAAASNLIKINAGAKVTLTGNGTVSFGATTPDTNWGGVGQPAFPGYANNTISNLGELVIDGVTIENVTAPGGASYAIDCYQGSSLTVNSGVIDGMGKCAIRMFCNSNTEETKVTINGGTITGKRAIWVQLPGSNIANVRPVNLTINGGKLISTNDSDVCIYSYSYGDSFAGTNITITGGEFVGDVCFGGGEKTTQENVTVTGGTFHGELGRYVVDDGTNDGWEAIAKP